MANVTAQIGIDHESEDYWRAAEIGRAAALRVTSARQGDKFDDFAPDTPQAYLLRTFGGIGNITKTSSVHRPHLPSHLKVTKRS